MTLEDAFHEAWVGKVDPQFPGRLVVDPRSYGLSTTASAATNRQALNDAFTQADVVLMPYGGRYPIDQTVQNPANKILWGPGSVSGNGDVGPVIAAASGFLSGTPVLDLQTNSELHGVRIDAASIADIAVKVTGDDCSLSNFSAMNGLTKGLQSLGKRTIITNFIAKATGAIASNAFYQDGEDIKVFGGLAIGGTTTFETHGTTGTIVGLRCTGNLSSDPVALLAGGRVDLVGFLVDGGTQSVKVMGSFYNLVSTRFHGNGLWDDSGQSGHAFIRAAIEVDGATDCSGLVVDDFSLTPVGPAPIGSCNTTAGSGTVSNLAPAATSTMLNRPILIRDGVANGQDLVARVTAVNTGANTITVNPAPSQTLTGAVYVLKGWKNIIEFLAGSSQSQNKARCLLGTGSAHYCKSDLWAPSNLRPGALGLIEQTGRYSRNTGTDQFVGTGTSKSVTHGLINTPRIASGIPSNQEFLWASAKAAATFTVNRKANGVSNLAFDWFAEL